MNSLTMDTSIFALPPENENIDLEYKNIKTFLTNLEILQYLEKKCPSITINYMNKIPETLSKINNDSSRIKKRIYRLKDNDKELEYSSIALLEYWKNIYIKLCYDIENNRKGKIGIHENIPDRNNDPDEGIYREIIYNKNIYPEKYGNNLLKTFEKYLGFIAELNYKYFSENDNYIVISDNLQKYKIEIKMCFSNNKISNVNIIGMQNVINLFDNNEIINLDKIKKLFISNANIIYGYDVSININKELSNKNNNYLSKIYNYLSTTDLIVNIIREKNMNINNEEEWTRLINSHGCLCSPDNEKYIKCPLKTRHFKNEQGIKEYFSLHLKPITYSKKYDHKNLTRRIYFKWVKDKFLIGWIGEHPKSCSNEPESECVKINCQYRPKGH